MASEELSPALGRFVWEKWRHVWYMGRIVDQLLGSGPTLTGEGGGGGESLSSPTPASAAVASISSPLSRRERQVKIHTHGEPDTNDKWFPLASANLELLAVIPSEMTAVGGLPALNEYVELLLMDQALHDLLLLPFRPEETPEPPNQQLTLVGRVAQVLPAHDASVVDVEYPPAYHPVVRERRVHIGNGYLNVISEDEFQDRQRRLEEAIALAYAVETTSSSTTSRLHT